MARPALNSIPWTKKPVCPLRAWIARADRLRVGQQGWTWLDTDRLQSGRDFSSREGNHMIAASIIIPCFNQLEFDRGTVAGGLPAYKAAV